MSFGKEIKSRDLIELDAAGRLKDSFYAPLRYKTNSLWQETVAEQSKVPFITQEV